MVPLDAPTQIRNYHGASKTSRKVIPAAFSNKLRKRSREEAGFALDEDDELVVDDVPKPVQDQIEAKRRQNTLAARRSRQRKAETAKQQADVIEALTDENARLRSELERVKTEYDALRRLTTGQI
jgi:small-conductance mechanosensitive channel